MTLTKEIEEAFGKAPAFSILDAKRLLRGRTTDAYLRLLFHKQVKEGRMHRITKSAYTYRNEAETVGFAFRPFYYGLQEALSLRNLWEQETNCVVLTPKKVRAGRREFLGRNYILRRIPRGRFFGFEMVRYYDFWIPVSDVEKTLIDFVYFRERMPENALGEIKQKIRKDVLEDYLLRYPKGIGRKVRGLLGSKKGTPSS